MPTKSSLIFVLILFHLEGKRTEWGQIIFTVIWLHVCLFCFRFNTQKIDEERSLKIFFCNLDLSLVKYSFFIILPGFRNESMDETPWVEYYSQFETGTGDFPTLGGDDRPLKLKSQNTSVRFLLFYFSGRKCMRDVSPIQRNDRPTSQSLPSGQVQTA